MTFFDPDDYGKNWVGYLGEFAFTNGSGWMYSVNTVFPNVGFSDCYLSDGDVVRVQFTLGYGADIGGFSSVGTSIPDVGTQPTGGYYPVADKDRLTEALCRARTSGLLGRANVREAYNAAQDVMAALDAVQETVDAAAVRLHDALAHPADETQSTGPDDSSSNGSTEPDSIAPEPDASDATPDVSATPETAETAEPVSGTPSETASDPGTDSEASQGCRSTAAPTLLLLIALAAAPLLTAGRAGRRREGNGRNG